MTTTLREWSRRTGIHPTTPTPERGAVTLTVDHLHPDRRELWSLSDYVVTCVSGPVVWFLPRSEESQS